MTYWWTMYGPFGPDPSDPHFPNAGQVVQHYRTEQMKWTEADLAEALGRSVEWVQHIEQDNAMPAAIPRRRQIAQILHIPGVLFGLTPAQMMEEEPEPVQETLPLFDQMSRGAPVSAKPTFIWYTNELKAKILADLEIVPVDGSITRNEAAKILRRRALDEWGLNRHYLARNLLPFVERHQIIPQDDLYPVHQVFLLPIQPSRGERTAMGNEGSSSHFADRQARLDALIEKIRMAIEREEDVQFIIRSVELYSDLPHFSVYQSLIQQLEARGKIVKVGRCYYCYTQAHYQEVLQTLQEVSAPLKALVDRFHAHVPAIRPEPTGTLQHIPSTSRSRKRDAQKESAFCLDCHVPIDSSDGPSRLRCDQCQEKRQKDYQRQYYLKRHATSIIPEGCMSPVEFARRIGVSTANLQYWHKEGSLVAHLTSTNRHYYTEEQYREYVNRVRITYTSAEFAAKIGRSVPVLRLWDSKGVLKARHVPHKRTVYYTEEDVQFVLNGGIERADKRRRKKAGSQ